MGCLQSVFQMFLYLGIIWKKAGQVQCSSGGIGRGKLYISQTCANILSAYYLACKVPLLVLMLVCIRAGFCFELGWVREPELEFVLTNYADLNVVVI